MRDLFGSDSGDGSTGETSHASIIAATCDTAGALDDDSPASVMNRCETGRGTLPERHGALPYRWQPDDRGVAVVAKSDGKLDRFDRYVPAEPWLNPWQSDATYAADHDLLVTLLSVAVGTEQRSGIVAGAADVWAAEELRRAGFDPDEVWPRRTQPRVMPRDVRNFVEGGALTKKLRAEVEQRYHVPKAKSALPSEAHVTGSAYTKQADVVVASWSAGVELLVSTKTMLSSYQKNLRNRFEEGYGDAKNLRGRHPLAALGFLFIVGADVPPKSLEFAIDMLRKLVREPDVYDCACLIVLEGGEGIIEEDGEERGPEDEPSALLPLSPAGEDDESVDGESTPPVTPPIEVPPPSTSVSLQQDRVPHDLSADHFFEVLIGCSLDRMPVAIYPEVRRRFQAATAPDEN